MVERVLSFYVHASFAAWPDQGAALSEVRTFVQAERISRGALDDHGTLLGWIGGLPNTTARSGNFTRWWWGDLTGGKGLAVPSCATLRRR